jgi:hypothetical protein
MESNHYGRLRPALRGTLLSPPSSPISILLLSTNTVLQIPLCFQLQLKWRPVLTCMKGTLKLRLTLYLARIYNMPIERYLLRNKN